MSKQRRTFTEEFKQEAVKLTRQPGAGKAAIARDLEIGVNLLDLLDLLDLLARWVKAKEEALSSMRSNNGEGASSQEYDRMRCECPQMFPEYTLAFNGPDWTSEHKKATFSWGECGFYVLFGSCWTY